MTSDRRRIMEARIRVPGRGRNRPGRGNRNEVRMQQKRNTPRVNLLHAHGSPTNYQYVHHGCRCTPCRSVNTQRGAMWRAKDPDRRKEYERRFYAEHPEKQAERTHRYVHAHPDERSATCRRSHIAHPETRPSSRRNHRARAAAAPGFHTAADVAAQYLRQHGRCYWCRAKVGKTYHVDHVFPLVRDGSNGPDNLVIACPACNLAKGAKLPHEFAERMC